MTFSGDPFRVLGVQSGATEEEIKRAYRALAKRFHPDSAGEKALPRFLAIQAAYDMLTAPGGRARARTTARATPAGPPSPPGAAPPRSGRTSEADAERSRATREAFRRARARPAPGPAGPTGGPAWWAAGARPKPGAGPTKEDGAAGPTDEAASAEAGPGPAPRGRRRTPRVATLGSTSYDDAPRDPEPSWNGASWYGDTSGTYWTINPKEYADPRKHGPEYLARARRRAQADPTRATDEDFGTPDGTGPGLRNDTAAGAAPTGAPGPTAPGPTAPGPTVPPPTAGAWRATGRTTADAGFDARASWSTTASGGPGQPGPSTTAAADPGISFEPPPRPAAASAPSSRPASAAPPRPAAAANAAPRRATAAAAAGVAFDPRPPRGTRRGGGSAGGAGRDSAARSFDAALSQRLIVALIAWLPLGLAAGALIGELTGCGRYAATCTEPESLLGWLVQPAIVGVLLLFPALARPAAVAAMTTGVGAIIGGVVLSILGGTRVPAAASSLLFAILLMSYAVGLVGAMSGRLPLPAWLRVDAEET